MASASEAWAEDYLPVDLASSEPPRSRPVVTDPKIAVLPFDDLCWEDFERLLLDVAQAVDKLVEARRYGVSGQEQAGIDVAGRASDGSWHVYQAKKVARLSRAQMRTALDTFVAGRRPFDARRLVVATACPGTRAEVSDLIYDYRTQHPGLEFDQVWDAEHLSRVLRRHPLIVGRYFGDGVAWRFCDVDVLSAYRSPDGVRSVLGVALGQADPLTLGVHEAIEPLHRSAQESALPPYFRRPLDSLLDDVVRCARHGDSATAILVGNSSTGKSRAAWEAVRGLPSGWRVWHPRSGPEILDARGRIAPRTVIWLDEAKDVLLSGDIAADERVAAALGGLVRDPECAPVLLLGTTWHEHWIRMTLAPGVVDDRKQTRTLLERHRIDVPEYFSDEELAELLAGPAARDERLKEAAKLAEDRHVVQYLAGGPAQLRRYELAPPSERAVLDAAIDARRLSSGFRLTEQFLAAAAESALTGLQRDLLADGWFDKVIAYTSAPCRGARGVLSRVRRPLLEEAEPMPGLRLADYLEQVVSRRRAQVCPSEGFWLAAVHFAASTRDHIALVRAALGRGRLDAADRLAARAAELGNPHGLVLVAEHLEKEFPDRDALSLFVRAAEAGDSSAQLKLAWRYEKADRLDEAKRWYRAAVDGGERSDAVVGLASVLWKQGEHEAAMDLYEQALDDGHARSVEYQARHLAGKGDHELALALTCRSFEAGNTEAFTGLAWRYMSSDHDRAIEVFKHAIKAGDVNALRELAWVMEQDGDRDAADVYCEFAVACGEINTLRGLGMIRASRGDVEGARALFWRAYNAGLSWVLPQIGELHEKAGALRKAERIYRRCIRENAMPETAAGGLVRVYENSGRCERAYALAMTKPKDLVPTLARVRVERGDFQGAAQLLQLLVDSGHVNALTQLAQMSKAAGDLDGAEALLRRACDAGAFGAQRALRELCEQRVA